jgi:hypothetical protein
LGLQLGASGKSSPLGLQLGASGKSSPLGLQLGSTSGAAKEILFRSDDPLELLNANTLFWTKGLLLDSVTEKKVKYISLCLTSFFRSFFFFFFYLLLIHYFGRKVYY